MRSGEQGSHQLPAAALRVGTDRARTPDDRAQDQGRKVPGDQKPPLSGMLRMPCRAADQLQLQGHPVAEQGPDHATGPR